MLYVILAICFACCKPDTIQMARSLNYILVVT